MTLTPETLIRHELIGLPVQVVAAANTDLRGISGRVVDETRQMLHIGAVDARVCAVPKQHTRFEFVVGTDTRVHAADTDETAGDMNMPGTASELQFETTSATHSGQSNCCEDVAYVTVDGSQLLSRPVLRTEKAGDRLWQ